MENKNKIATGCYNPSATVPQHIKESIQRIVDTCMDEQKSILISDIIDLQELDVVDATDVWKLSDAELYNKYNESGIGSVWFDFYRVSQFKF